MADDDLQDWNMLWVILQTDRLFFIIKNLFALSYSSNLPVFLHQKLLFSWTQKSHCFCNVVCCPVFMSSFRSYHFAIPYMYENNVCSSLSSVIVPLAFSVTIFFSVGGCPKWLFAYFTALNLKPAVYKILACILQNLVGQCFMTVCMRNTDAQRIIWSLGSYLGIIIFFIIHLSSC